MRSAKGSIQKLPNGSYRVRVNLSRDENGKRRECSKVVRGSRTLATETLATMLANSGDYDVQFTMTFGDYAQDVFLPKVKQKRKAKTYEGYEARLRLHVLPILKETKLSDITPAAINRLLDGLKPTVAKECRKTLSALFTEAVYDGYVKVNPCNAVRPIEVPYYEPDVLEDWEIAEYIEHFRDNEVEAAVLLAIGGGFRRGEIAALNVEDIDFSTGAVTIDDANVSTSSRVVNTDTKTHRQRIVHLPMAITSRLNDILPQTGAIFPASTGRMHPDRISQLYRKHLKTLPENVQRVTLKNLRHSSLTLAYDSGVELSDVANRGGHSTSATTSRYYLRPKGERDIQAAQKMDDVLAALCRNSTQPDTRDEMTQAFEQDLRRTKLVSCVSF